MKTEAALKETTKKAGAVGAAPAEEKMHNTQDNNNTDKEKKQLFFQVNDKITEIDIALEKARVILNDLYLEYLASKHDEESLLYFQDHARTQCEITDDYLIICEKLLADLHTFCGHPE